MKIPFHQRKGGHRGSRAGKAQKERKEKPKTSGSKMLEKQIRALEREIEKQEQLSAQLDTQIEAAASDYQELARLMAESSPATMRLPA